MSRLYTHSMSLRREFFSPLPAVTRLTQRTSTHHHPAASPALRLAESRKGVLIRGPRPISIEYTRACHSSGATRKATRRIPRNHVSYSRMGGLHPHSRHTVSRWYPHLPKSPRNDCSPFTHLCTTYMHSAATCWSTKSLIESTYC